MPSTLRSLLVALSCLGCVVPAGASERWTEFRGPNGTGHADVVDLPTEWSESEHVAWKVPIHGKGWSSPVVEEGRVWLTTATEDGKRMSVLCLDLASGRVLHDAVLFENEQVNPLNNPMNSFASPTPVVEQGRVYVTFGRYGTACLDTATFRTVWQRRDVDVHHWRGPGSSPILVGDLLVLNFDGYDRQFVIAFDKRTGETRWQRDREIDYGTDNGDAKKGYSTPGVFEFDGRRQLVSPSAGATISYDPATGRELWRVNHGGMNAATRPVLADGLLVVNTASGGLGLVAVKPDGAGDVSKTHIAWSTHKGVGTRPSPIVVDGLLYQVSDKGGALTCLEPRTGEVVWQDRLDGAFTASPVYADGKLYFCDEAGRTSVVKPGRTFDLLATNELEAGCMATPAIVDAGLLIRTRTHLYLIAE